MSSLKNKELLIFCKNISILLNSGQDITKTLNILKEQSSKNLEKVINEITTSINDGNSISESFEKTNSFSYYFINLIKSGEKSGNISDTFKNLALFYEKEAKISSKIKSSIAYPIILLLLIIFVTIFVVLYFVPKYREFYEYSNVKAPKTLDFLFRFSLFIKSNYIIIIFFILLILFCLYIFRFRLNLKERIDFLKIYLFKNIFLNQAIIRFTDTLLSLIKSGVNIIDAINLSSLVVNNLYLINKISISKDLLQKGNSLSYSMDKCSIFPNTIISLIKIGEESGNLEQSLQTINKFYTEEFELSIDKFIKNIEPTLIIISGLMVFMFVIVMIVPMYDAMSLI